MDRQATTTQSAQAGPSSSAARPVLSGDALLQARVKAALDNVKLALQDFKEEVQASHKLGDELAAVRRDLNAVRESWEQHAADSSDKLTTRLESTLSSLLSPLVKELGATSNSLSSSLGAVSTSVTDGEARIVHLLQTHFSSLRTAQNEVSDAVRSLESNLKAEIRTIKAELSATLLDGISGPKTMLEALSKTMAAVQERQERFLEGLEAAKVKATELSDIKSMMERAEQERQLDREAFRSELASISSTLAPFTASLSQLTTFVRSNDPSRTSSHGSMSFPTSAQPAQMQRAPSSNATQSVEGGDSLGSHGGRKRAGGRTSSSESDSLRSNDHRSKTQSPPRVPRRKPSLASDKNVVPSSSAPSGGYSRSYTTPPEAVIAEERQQYSAFAGLSPTFGPSTQSLIHERSPSPATRLRMGSVVETAVTSLIHVAATTSSSAPERLIGGGGATTAEGGGKKKRQRRQIAQSSDDEFDKQDHREEKRRKDAEEEEEPGTQ